MLTRDGLTPLLNQTALFWSACWDRGASARERLPEFVPDGNARLQELTATMGMELWANFSLRAWGKFEGAVALLASEMRFRIFRQRESAAQAALNVAMTVLDEAGYRPSAGDWSDFSAAVLRALYDPRCYDDELKKCITRHLSRPQ
jgi:hypothetical protein